MLKPHTIVRVLTPKQFPARQQNLKKEKNRAQSCSEAERANGGQPSTLAPKVWKFKQNGGEGEVRGCFAGRFILVCLSRQVHRAVFPTDTRRCFASRLSFAVLIAHAIPVPLLLRRRGQRFADMATDLGTTLFAFIKAQVLMARRARDGSTDAATKVHRRASNAEAAAAVVDANLSGGDGGGASGGDGDPTGRSSATGASPQAWAKLGYLTYTRDKNSEKMPFPAGMVVLLKAVTDVLNHCVGTGDLAVSK